jgi:hypothetical protein
VGARRRWKRPFDFPILFTTGAVDVNSLGDESEERAKAAYGAHYDRLIALKRKYDPTHWFRMHQHIKPTV